MKRLLSLLAVVAIGLAGVACENFFSPTTSTEIFVGQDNSAGPPTPPSTPAFCQAVAALQIAAPTVMGVGEVAQIDATPLDITGPRPEECDIASGIAWTVSRSGAHLLVQRLHARSHRDRSRRGRPRGDRRAGGRQPRGDDPMRYLFLAVAVLLQPVLAESQEAESQEAESQEKIHVRYNLNSSAGYTHIGKEGIDDTANRDKYVNFSASAFVEFPNKVFLSGLCATEGVPGELAWNTPSTWKRAYCDLAAGYLAFEIPEQNLTIGAFAFVGQQFKITTPEGGTRAEPYPARFGGGFGPVLW